MKARDVVVLGCAEAVKRLEVAMVGQATEHDAAFRS